MSRRIIGEGKIVGRPAYGDNPRLTAFAWQVLGPDNSTSTDAADAMAVVRLDTPDDRRVVFGLADFLDLAGAAARLLAEWVDNENDSARIDAAKVASS